MIKQDTGCSVAMPDNPDKRKYNGDKAKKEAKCGGK